MTNMTNMTKMTNLDIVFVYWRQSAAVPFDSGARFAK